MHVTFLKAYFTLRLQKKKKKEKKEKNAIEKHYNNRKTKKLWEGKKNLKKKTKSKSCWRRQNICRVRNNKKNNRK